MDEVVKFGTFHGTKSKNSWCWVKFVNFVNPTRLQKIYYCNNEQAYWSYCINVNTQKNSNNCTNRTIIPRTYVCGTKLLLAGGLLADNPWLYVRDELCLLFNNDDCSPCMKIFNNSYFNTIRSVLLPPNIRITLMHILCSKLQFQQQTKNSLSACSQMHLKNNNHPGPRTCFMCQFGSIPSIKGSLTNLER